MDIKCIEALAGVLWSLFGVSAVLFMLYFIVLLCKEIKELWLS